MDFLVFGTSGFKAYPITFKNLIIEVDSNHLNHTFIFEG